jgi:hypothetical protein
MGEAGNTVTRVRDRHSCSDRDTSYQLLLASDFGYISKEDYDELWLGFQRVGQMLTRLAQSLDH